jgi:hypothetical protein
MRKLLLSLFFAILITASASAQIFKIGLRGGVNITNGTFSQISTGDYRINSLKSKPGYQIALVSRISIPKFVQISPELQMTAHNYRYRVSGASSGEVKVAVKRLELPVTVGFNISVFRLFGGPVFRLAHSEKSDNKRLGLEVKYNDSDVALVAGAGLDLGRFFVDARYTFYPKKSRNEFIIDHTHRKAQMKNDGMWQFSAGFFF